MSQQQKTNLLIGSLLILAGALILLKKFFLLPEVVTDVVFSWPMLLIVVGLISLKRSQKSTGILLILVGIVFLIPYTGLIPHWSADKFWPVFLIIIGISLLVSYFRRQQNTRAPEDHLSVRETNDGDFIQEAAIFGGSEKTIISKNLKGGRIQCMFGGVKLNMTHAELANQQAVMEIYLAFGGLEIMVPPGWIVKAEITPIFGGFSDKRYIKPTDNAPTLIIRGNVIFGGCEVKSYL
ncbi:MAG: LiaI-LiaF-like domain-containing protein [Bacteroidales bacterium]